MHGDPESYIPLKVEMTGICFEVLLNLAPRGEIRIICETLVRVFQHYGSFVHRRSGMGKSLKLDYTREVSLDKISWDLSLTTNLLTLTVVSSSAVVYSGFSLYDQRPPTDVRRSKMNASKSCSRRFLRATRPAGPMGYD